MALNFKRFLCLLALSITTCSATTIPAQQPHVKVRSMQSRQTTAAYPTAFDSSLGDNFTQSTCPTFFNTFLKDPSFISCHPVSMMLQTSNSFFQALKSQVLLTRTLDAACSANISTCAPLMASYATKLKSQCSKDFDLGNPLVAMAYAGFQSYSPLYEATCLRDQSYTNSSTRAGGTYCFATAATNSSNPAGIYTYYLPLGVALPGGARMTCNWCLQKTLEGFAKYASNALSALATTYTPAATLVDEVCGPTFVNTSAQTPQSSAIHTASLTTFGPWAVIATSFFLFL